MVAPQVIAAGISAGAGLLGGLLGRDKSPEISYNPLSAPDILGKFNLTPALQAQRNQSVNNFTNSQALFDDARGMLPGLSQMPQLGSREMQELSTAEGIFGQNFALAQNNLNNSTASQSSSLARTMELMGAPSGGAGAQSAFASIAAKNQASLNEFQMGQSQQLLGLRQQLLQGVYDRMMNQYNARMNASGQAFNMGQSLFSNVYNASTAQAQAQLQVDQYNNQAKAASEASQDSGGLFGGLF